MENRSRHSAMTALGRLPFALLVLVATFSGSPVEAKRKDDVVIMKDGDKFTGEVKKLETGILYFKADYMVSSVQLDWARVERLESKDNYNVSLTDGTLRIGLIEVAPDDGGFSLQANGALARVRLAEVVFIVPVEETFLAQLTGSFDYGFNFTSGNNVTQSSVSGATAYRAAKWRIQVSGSSVFNRQTDAEKSGRNSLGGIYTRSFSQHWFMGANAAFLNSEQQDLTLRTTFGGGVGRDFVKSGTAGLFILGGVAFSREKYSAKLGDQPAADNAEAQIQARFFKATFTKMRFDGNLAAYPNITTAGRVRLSAEISWSIEIYRNLYWKLSLYENFDNKPPVNAPRNDFGIGTSIGWTF